MEGGAAAVAASSGQTSSAVEQIAGVRTGEAAVPLSAGRRLRWVVVLSTPLADVDDNVALIRRQILIAGGDITHKRLPHELVERASVAPPKRK